MTDQQSKQITNMRESGLGYTTIASQIGLSKDCVKSYCRTHGLTGRRSSSHVDKEVGSNTCRTCGRYLQHTPGKRKKQYCSDACRMDWWNGHQDKVKRKAYYSFT
ncbi:MAG: RNA polymerase subunit sigma-70, partial [Spirochaetia bacterium]|nr:RNA polymerase subunit sigma-70 [Spirochaetia bacterium]